MTESTHSQTLRSPGIYPSDRVDAPTEAGLRRLTMSGHTTLADIAKEYVLFNHGALRLYLRCPGDPVSRWCTINEGKMAAEIGVIQLPKPVLKGLTSYWNSVLLACHKTDWANLSRYMDMDTVLIRDEHFYCQPLPQTRVPCVDILALYNSETLPDCIPMVEIELYGTDGNNECRHFKPALNPLIDTIELICDTPFNNTVTLANSLLNTRK